jgi:hypothetical protein
MTLRDLSVSGLYRLLIISTLLFSALKSLFVLALLPFADGPIDIKYETVVPIGPINIDFIAPIPLIFFVELIVFLLSAYIGALILRGLFKHTPVGKIRVG